FDDDLVPPKAGNGSSRHTPCAVAWRWDIDWSFSRKVIRRNRGKLIRHDAGEPFCFAVCPIRGDCRRRIRLMPRAEWAGQSAGTGRRFDKLIRPAGTLAANNHPAARERILAKFGHRGW